MGLNLSSISNLNPTVLATKAAIYVAAVSLVFVSGYVTGCVHNQHKVASDKLEASENARRLEHTDAAQETAAASKNQKEQQGIEAAGKEAAQKVPEKPVVVVHGRTKACPDQPTTKELATTTKDEEVKNETPSVDFSAHSMQLYDLSISGGSTAVRQRTYEESTTVPVDEGLQKIVIPNNTSCALIANQLNALIDRIKEKQQLFGHKE